MTEVIKLDLNEVSLAVKQAHGTAMLLGECSMMEAQEQLAFQGIVKILQPAVDMFTPADEQGGASEDKSPPTDALFVNECLFQLDECQVSVDTLRKMLERVAKPAS